jgi:hypothetical protein
MSPQLGAEAGHGCMSANYWLLRHRMWRNNQKMALRVAGASGRITGAAPP